MPTTGNQLADFFVKVGVLAKDFDKEWLRIERTVKEAKSSNKFAFNFKVDPTNLKSLNKELDRLKARAAELRGNLLTVKPTVENPNAVADLEHELSKVEHQMQLVSKAADDVRAKTNRLKEVGDKIGSVGSKLTLGLTAPIMALGGFVAGPRPPSWDSPPSGSTTSTASTCADVTPEARQCGPPALVATLPPIVHACCDDGSGA
jgi:hypothetical protein